MKRRLVGRVPAIGAGPDPLDELAPGTRRLIHRIRSANLTYLSDRKLAGMAQTLGKLEAEALPGCVVEAGCALGGSAILIASVKAAERPLFVYDVFGMIPAPTSEDTPDVHERYRTIVQGASKGIGGDRYYGYEENLYELVQSNLERFGVDIDRQHVALIQGLVQNTLHLDQPVAFAHVDVDWYEPVKTCLERLFPHLVVGGSIVLDDYFAWGGCRKATDEFLRTVVGQVTLDDSVGGLKLTRVSAPG